MKFVRLGQTGLKVSALCLGCMTYGSSKWRSWVLDERDAQGFYSRALELGITFFDTADMYSLGASEEVTGKALKDLARRDEVVVATKVYNPMSDKPNDRGLSRKHIMKSIDGSLKRLRMDHVDLYQIHRFDDETPIEETLSALHDVVKAGKALYIGASTMPAWKLSKALYAAERLGLTRFVSMQNHYNLAYREEEREMIPLCLDQGLGLIPYSPLARGFLAGNRPRESAPGTERARTDVFSKQYYHSEADFAVAAAVAAVAKTRGVTPAQIALAWVAGRPGVAAPIIGASKPGQLEEAVAALDIALTPEECKALEAPYQPRTLSD